MDALYFPQIQFILKQGKGIKACLFDDQTRPMISCLVPLSLFNDNGYFHFDLLSNKSRCKVEGMCCVVILRPDSLKLLLEELVCPFYSNYIVLFTSQVDPLALELMANADINSLISEVHEINLDLYKQAPNLYITGSNKYKRNLEGLCSAIFSLEIAPVILIYNEIVDGTLPTEKESFSTTPANKINSCILNTPQSTPIYRSSTINLDNKEESSSENAFSKEDKGLQMLSKNLRNKFTQYNFPNKGTVVVLKRNFDLITPLVQDWHYQSVINDFLSLRDNVVILNNKPHTLNDSFSIKNMFNEITKVGEEIKKLVREVEKNKLGIANFEEIQGVLTSKSIAEMHLNIYNKVAVEAEKLVLFSEAQHKILDSSDFNISPMLNDFTDIQSLNLLLIYFLKNCCKNWKESAKLFPKYEKHLMKFYEQHNPQSYCYKYSLDSNLDPKLSYISPIKKMIKHICLNKVKENAFINSRNDIHTTSPLILYIDGGITFREYREAVLCAKTYEVELILISTEILSMTSFLKDYSFIEE